MAISTIEIAWAAGFLEGEGSFGSHNKLGTPCVRAAQVQKEPLDRLARMFGGGLRLCRRNRKDPRNANSKDIWSWYLYGQRAIEIGMTVFTLLSPKRQEQCAKMIGVWRALGNRPNAPALRKAQTHCKSGHEFTPENTKPYLSKRWPGGRQCRECHRLDGRRRYWRMKIGNTETLQPLPHADSV